MDDITRGFAFQCSSPRVVFGAGAFKKVPDELRRLNVSSPLLLSSPTRISLAESLKALLEAASITPAGIYDKVAMHCPIAVTEDALRHIAGADSVVSVGGGSTVGLGKAIAVRTGLPHVCVTTTYSGSEMTAILGETRDGRKTTRADPRLLPTTVVYDVELTLALPPRTSAVSGLNALAHCIDALFAKEANPVMTIVALEAVRALALSLPKVVSTPSSVEARSSVLYGAFLAGMTVASTGVALQHKLAHVLGGSFNLPHAEAHAIILPHTSSYNLGTLSPQTLGRLAEALLPGSAGSVEDVISSLNGLLKSLGVPGSLEELGLNEEDLDRAADIAMETPYWNPRPMEKDKIREILRRAWAGEPARADL